MPATIATIIAVKTDAMILFHSKDGIGVLFDSAWSAAGRPRENRIPAGNSTELSRFRRASEPGILSLPACRMSEFRPYAHRQPDRHDPGPPGLDAAAEPAPGRDPRRAADR